MLPEMNGNNRPPLLGGSLERELMSLRKLVEKQKEEISRCMDVERSLRESEEKYRFLVENSRDITWKIDLQGRWTFVSSNVEKILGYKPYDIIGHTIWDFLTPEYYVLVKEKLHKRMLGEETPPYEVEVIAKDGHHVPFDILSAAIVKNGKIVGIQGISRDTSYRREAEKRLKIAYEDLEARVAERTAELTRANDLLRKEINERIIAERSLRESEEKFRVLAETSAAAIFVYQGFRFISANQAAVAITGYAKDELYKMNILDIVHPDFKALVGKHSQARQRGEPAPYRYEFKIATKQGGERWIEITAGRILYNGQPAGVATLFDITERKKAEEALLDAKAQADLYLDLICHDINNMNQVSLGFLELAGDTIDSGGNIGKNNRELIDKPVASLNNSSALIDKVLKLRKLKETGPKLELVDICDVLSRLKSRYSHIAGRGITISYEPSKECIVLANRLIDELFINLIENSIKHSPPDKPLAIQILQTTVCSDGKEYFMVSVEDNGPGIADSVKNKLFTRYFRGMARTKGKGLGLYLVKTLVEGFNGQVWAEDRVAGDPAKGVRFVVLIPAAGQ
jgi:PAS domain S-box-containing protein